MARDISTAFLFGAHPSVGAFMAAFRLSSLLRRLLGEGPFQSAFIPYFAEMRLQGKQKDFFRQLTFFLCIVLLGATLLGEVFASTFLRAGYFSEGSREVLSLFRLLLPGALFICLFGLNISLHHSHNSFFLPSVAPAICNIFWVGAVFYLRDVPAEAAMASLAKVVVLGYVAQWLISFPFVWKKISFKLKDFFHFRFSKELLKFMKVVGLAVIGVGAMQVNAACDPFFARVADLSGPVYLWNAIRLQQLVFSLFGIAATSTMIPRLTRAIKEGREAVSLSLFQECSSRIYLLMIPCTFATLTLGLSAIHLLYGRGAYDLAAVTKTFHALFAYGLGLIPASLVLLFTAIFYAKNRFLLPGLVAVGMMVLNIVLNALFVFFFSWKSAGVALATTCCSWVNCIWLYLILRKEGWRFGQTKTLRLMFASSAAALLTLAVPAVPNKGLAFFSQAGTFGLSVLLFSLLFRCKELWRFTLDFFGIVDKNVQEQ